MAPGTTRLNSSLDVPQNASCESCYVLPLRGLPEKVPENKEFAVPFKQKAFHGGLNSKRRKFKMAAPRIGEERVELLVASSTVSVQKNS